jgi:DNA-binding transcriptional MerR regulator
METSSSMQEHQTPEGLPDSQVEDFYRGMDDNKSQFAFRTISEVSQEIDVPQHVLRFWESKFAQLKPLKRGGGRRYYRPEDIELLRRIKNFLYKQGYTIKGVQRLLREKVEGATPATASFAPYAQPFPGIFQGPSGPAASVPVVSAASAIAVASSTLAESFVEEQMPEAELLQKSLAAVTRIQEALQETPPIRITALNLPSFDEVEEQQEPQEVEEETITPAAIAAPEIISPPVMENTMAEENRRELKVLLQDLIELRNLLRGDDAGEEWAEIAQAKAG